MAAGRGVPGGRSLWSWVVFMMTGSEIICRMGRGLRRAALYGAAALAIVLAAGGVVALYTVGYGLGNWLIGGASAIAVVFAVAGLLRSRA